VAVFYVVMALAGLAVGGLFSAFDAVPARRNRPIAPPQVSWDYTTFLNMVFIAVAAAVYWLHRNRERLGAATEYARDPVCGMQVRRTEAPASAVVDGHRAWYCSDRCRRIHVGSDGEGNDRPARQSPGTGKGRKPLLGPRSRA
jgi:uncharacterized protein